MEGGESLMLTVRSTAIVTLAAVFSVASCATKPAHPPAIDGSAATVSRGAQPVTDEMETRPLPPRERWGGHYLGGL